MRAETFTEVDFIDIEPDGGTKADTAVTSEYLLAMAQRASTDILAGAASNLYVFVGVETYADAFAESAFTLRRRFGAASVFALDTRRENPAARPVDSEWGARRSLASRATLLTFDSRFEVRTTGGAPVKVLPDPRLGKISRAVRERARAKMNLSDSDFALTVISGKASSADAARIARPATLIRTLMLAQSSRLLIAGSPHEAIAPWLADLSATFPGQTRMLAACADGICGADAADLLLIPGGELGVSCSPACVEGAAQPEPEAIAAEREHRMVVLDEYTDTDDVDDFIQAVSLLPLRTSRGIEMLRDSFVANLQAGMDLSFGRSLYFAVIPAR